MISGLKGPGEKTLKSELVQFRFLQFVILLYWLPLEEWSGIKRGLDYLKQIKRRIHSRLRWHSDNNSSNINLKQIERICSSLSFFSFFLQIHKVWSLNRVQDWSFLEKREPSTKTEQMVEQSFSRKKRSSLIRILGGTKGLASLSQWEELFYGFSLDIRCKFVVALSLLFNFHLMQTTML